MKHITYKDMTISVDIFRGTFDVTCRTFERKGLKAEELAELIYPAVDFVAQTHTPAPPKENP